MSNPNLAPADQRLADIIADVNNDFTQDTSNMAVIAEAFFVDVFLPCFAGDENPKHAVTPELWMRVSRGPFNEVRVVDTQNQFLFDVPALYSQEAITPIDGTGKSKHMPTVTDMVRQAHHYSVRGPNAVQGFLSQELERRSFMFNQADMSQQNIARWNEIFKRYGRPALPVEATLQTTTATDANIARDSSEFDEIR